MKKSEKCDVTCSWTSHLGPLPPRARRTLWTAPYVLDVYS